MAENISEHTQEVAKGSIWGLAGNITFNIISFFYVILVARTVAQDDLGLFYLSLSIVTIMGIFSTLGLDVSLSRYIPYFEGRNEKGKIKSLLKSSYKIASVVALILVAILWLASDGVGAFFQNPRLPEVVRMLSVLVLLNAVFRINTEYLRGRADIKTMQINQ
ncbi:oligosaccharide flippase family protein, partial [Candidatus Micrarchaeota archaeon]|nr:oligosaccharide flippase family protein [Candidatus Micrarchaeota archaeon]